MSLFSANYLAFRFATHASALVANFTLHYAVFKVLLVGSSGLEPPTSRLSGVRSNQLSYEPKLCSGRPALGRFPSESGCFLCQLSLVKKAGGDERVRTDDPLLAKQVLSQLSYTPTVIPAFVLLPF